MKKNLSAEPNNPNGKTKLLTRSPNQLLDYDTDDELSRIDEKKHFFNVFDNTLEYKLKKFAPFSPMEYMKTLMCSIYNNDVSYEKSKQLGKEAFKEKYSFFKTRSFDGEEKYCFCNENQKK